MARRPEITVVLFSREGIVRADFGKKLQPTFKLKEDVDVESSFADAVRQVVIGQPAPGHQIIVVSSEVWSQIVLLPRMSVGGIDHEELEEALKFEAETLSGIEIDDIALAFNALGRQDEFERYWVSALRQSELDEVNTLLESTGCREIAIAHPAGLSSDTESNADIRIEIWENLAYFIGEQTHRLFKVKQASSAEFFSDPDIENANASLLGWNLESFRQLAPSNTSELRGDDAFNAWAASIAVNYTNHLDRLVAPLIRRGKRSAGTPIRHVVSGLIALLVFAVCCWHWNFAKSGNRKMVSQIEALKQPAEDKKQFDSQLISILEQRAEVELQDTALGDDLKRVQFFLDNQSNRIAKLLTLLIEQRTDNLVIENIAGSEEGVVISGISINGEAAQALAKRLRELATPLGWVVNPAKQEGQQKLTTGGPWNYEIILTDTGPFESAVQPRKKQATASKP